MQHLARKLDRHLPEGTSQIIASWILENRCEFRVAGHRKSKFGDYRAPCKGQGHRISVNGDLNPFAFLITTVHEFAHLRTWLDHKNYVKPHGKEWKDNFRQLMTPFTDKHVFPEDILNALLHYLKNPAASSSGDLNLYKILSAYDQQSSGAYIFLENLEENAHFLTADGRLFRKIRKRRVRFLCAEIHTKKLYLFSPIAKVLPYTAKHTG